MAVAWRDAEAQCTGRTISTIFHKQHFPHKLQCSSVSLRLATMQVLCSTPEMLGTVKAIRAGPGFCLIDDGENAGCSTTAVF